MIAVSIVLLYGSVCMSTKDCRDVQMSFLLLQFLAASVNRHYGTAAYLILTYEP